jgi:aspartate ammonia-lyase
MTTDACRHERDFLGSLPIPAQAYWGIHTRRAIDNFPISGEPVGRWREFVRAMGQVKKAAALVNAEVGVLDDDRRRVIVAACDDVIAGRLDDEFVVDVIQGGAGTSTNMNANEVIANRALEHMGQARGRYDLLHPNDHVNASQSTNDVYPTALRLATWASLESLLEELAALRQSFAHKAKAFDAVLKVGRTQLQDAVPMTLGLELGAFAAMIADDELRLVEARALLLDVNLGGTAIGTAINTPHGYPQRIVARLAEVSGVKLRQAAHLVAASQDTGAFLQLSGVLRRVACRLSKLSSDLRLLSSGPQAGFGDILLPPRQAGSSIMPGKVNPVIPEVVNQVAFEVIGNDLTITMACEGAQLQLNAFEPIIGWSLHKSVRHLTRACWTLRCHCVDGIEPNLPVLRSRVSESATLATALGPIIGYENAAMLSRHALDHGGTIADAAHRLGMMPRERAEGLLNLEALVSPLAVTEPGV